MAGTTWRCAEPMQRCQVMIDDLPFPRQQQRQALLAPPGDARSQLALEDAGAQRR
jgi:hypothetical protein